MGGGAGGCHDRGVRDVLTQHTVLTGGIDSHTVPVPMLWHPEQILSRFLWGGDSLFRARHVRIATVIGASLFGSAAYMQLSRFLNPIEVILALSLVLAAPVAVGKTSTACGVNALATFSQYALSPLIRIERAAAYAVTATLVSGAFGLVLSAAGDLGKLHVWLPAVAPVIFFLGLREFGYFQRIRIPSSNWQVPARWVRNANAAPLIWGIFLGSGLSTWMPNATFYGLMLLALVLPFPSGVLLMGLYGLSRSVPAVAAAVTARCSGQVALRHMWELRLLSHALNGFAAVAVAAAIVLFAVQQSGVLRVTQ